MSEGPGKKNYRNYIDGKEPLKYGVLPFDDDTIQAYIKRNMNRTLWVMPYEALMKWQESHKKRPK